MPKPRVSVLVPSFNHSRYISRCLNSIVDNGYPKESLEILVGDDRSLDGSQISIIAMSKKHDNIKYFFNEKNLGTVKNLNNLLNRANGKYVTMLASDDILLPGSIEARVDYLESRQDKKAVFGDCIVIDRSGQQTHESGLMEYHNNITTKEELNDDNIVETTITKWSCPGPIFMYERQAMIEFGGYDDEFCVEDYSTYIKFASKNWLGYLDKKVAAWRVHNSNSCMGKNVPKVFIDLARTAQKYKKLFTSEEHLAMLDKATGHYEKAAKFLGNLAAV